MQKEPSRKNVLRSSCLKIVWFLVVEVKKLKDYEIFVDFSVFFELNSSGFFDFIITGLQGCDFV